VVHTCCNLAIPFKLVEKCSQMINKSFYSFALQFIFMALVVWVVYALMVTTKANLEARDVESGFDFLSQRAGIPINVSLIDYSPNDTYGRAFLVGIINTIYTAIICIILATLIGVFMGIAQVSGNLLITRIAETYVEILRNVPVLLILLFIYGVVLAGLPSVRQAWEFFPDGFLTQRGIYFPRPIALDNFFLVVLALGATLIFSIFFTRWAKKRKNETGLALPVIRINLAVLLIVPVAVFFLTGQPLDWDAPVLRGFNFVGGMKLTPEFIALVVGLSIYRGAFIAENVRSGILAVPKGEIEAAKAIGLSPNRIMRSITLPQALRTIIPATTNDYASLVKDSSLAIAIGFADMVSIGGTMIGQNGQALEVIAIWMAVYLTINLIISVAMNLANSKFQIVER